jgi:hypothetical protein
MAVNPNEKLTGPPLLPNPTAPMDSSVAANPYSGLDGEMGNADNYSSNMTSINPGRGTVVEDPGARAAADAGALPPDKVGEDYVAKVAADKPDGTPTKAVFGNDGTLQSVDGKPVEKKADGSYGPKAPPGGSGAPPSKKSDDEPAPGGKKAKYLGNHVINTEAGHKIEIDNSPGDRRIHVYHASGTFIEIQDNGLRVSKIVDNDYEYITGNKTDVVHKDFFVHIDGDYLLRVMKKLKIEAGDIEIISHKDINLKSKENTLQEHGGDQRVQVNGHASHRASKDRDLITGGNSTINTLGNHYSTTVGNYTNIVSEGKYEMVGGLFYLFGNGMDIASGDAMGIAAAKNITVNSELNIATKSAFATVIDAGTAITEKVGSVGIKIDSSTVTTTATTYIGQSSFTGRAGPASPPFHSP